MTNWINTVSRDHVERGVRGRFTQANHGKPNMLRKMARGDWIIFYSPKKTYPDGEPLQAFTAIGQVADDEPYQTEVTPDLQPWRRNVDFLECAETPIRPLIERLDFIEDKSRWGYKFRFGVFKIEDHDFEVIRSAMTRLGLGLYQNSSIGCCLEELGDGHLPESSVDGAAIDPQPRYDARVLVHVEVVRLNAG